MMANYIIDIDFHEDDCSYCPFFERDGLVGYCKHYEGSSEIEGVIRESRFSPGDKVVCFDRPDWCPLVPVDNDKLLSLVRDFYAMLYGDKPYEMHDGFRERVKEVGLDVSGVGW